MKTEIERRFLVESKKLPQLKRGKLLTQGYLTKLRDETEPIVRVRVEGKRALLTIKLFESILSKKEFEYPIPIKEAEILLENCFASVQKIRYPVKIGKHIWQLDVYEGENYPLIIAEIEFKKENESFEKPLWILKEVSGDKRFHAYSLAIKPFNSWGKP